MVWVDITFPELGPAVFSPSPTVEIDIVVPVVNSMFFCCSCSNSVLNSPISLWSASISSLLGSKFIYSLLFWIRYWWELISPNSGIS